MTEKPFSESRPFRGIIPPLVTPLTARDQLDEAGLQRLVEHVIEGGVSGIFILGTTGEAPSLSYRLRGELIRRVCDLVEGRVPVLVGITDTAFVESIHMAMVAYEAGAAAVVLTTPYYFPAGQTELIGYVEHVVQELPLPLMLYNMPSLTKVWFEIDTLRQLADIETIVGVKDSSGDLDYFRDWSRLRDEVRGDWSIMLGPEHLLVEAIRLGCGRWGVRWRQRLSALVRRLLRRRPLRQMIDFKPQSCWRRSSVPEHLHDRQVRVPSHQGHQVRPVVARDLQRLHGRAVQPLPAARAARVPRSSNPSWRKNNCTERAMTVVHPGRTAATGHSRSC